MDPSHQHMDISVSTPTPTPAPPSTTGATLDTTSIANTPEGRLHLHLDYLHPSPLLHAQHMRDAALAKADAEQQAALNTHGEAIPHEEDHRDNTDRSEIPAQQEQHQQQQQQHQSQQQPQPQDVTDEDEAPLAHEMDSDDDEVPSNGSSAPSISTVLTSIPAIIGGGLLSFAGWYLFASSHQQPPRNEDKPPPSE